MGSILIQKPKRRGWLKRDFKGFQTFPVPLWPQSENSTLCGIAQDERVSFSLLLLLNVSQKRHENVSRE